MLAEERFAAILQLLNERRTATVAQFCEVTGASEATVRRDLAALDGQGRLVKVHGGATALEGVFESTEPDVGTKALLHVEQKDRIARYAARQIDDGDIVFLDAGTTTLRMVEYLGASGATFVTTGIDCARRLVEKGRRTFVIGGEIKPGTQAIVGAAALESLGRYNFTKAFLGTNGITVRQGFTTPDPEEALMKSKAAEQAYLTYVVADSSKFGRVSAAEICPLKKACIITDRLPDESYRAHAVIKEVDER